MALASPLPAAVVAMPIGIMPMPDSASCSAVLPDRASEAIAHPTALHLVVRPEVDEDWRLDTAPTRAARGPE